MAQKKSPSSFAKTIEELEALATRLEDSDTPLEDSLKDFESGIQLIRRAQKALLEAEQRVKVLLEQGGEPVATTLENLDYSSDKDER